MAEFAKGIYLDTYHGEYGDIINASINVEKIKENPIDDKGYVKIAIKKAKSGDWYQQLKENKKG